MNKKTIIALTSISLSALAVGALSFARFNQNSFSKADATPSMPVTLDSSANIVLEGDSSYFGCDKNIATGEETYITTSIVGEGCDFVNGTSNFLSFNNGGEDALLYIDLDVHGLTSIQINGDATGIDMEYYSYGPYISLVTKWNNPDPVEGGPTVIDSMNELEFGEVYKTNPSGKATETLQLSVNSFTTLSISSIVLTYSCATNN